MPIMRVMPFVSVRLVAIPIAVSGAGSVRLSATIALASIVVFVPVTAGIAVTLTRPAVRPWHVLRLHKTEGNNCHKQILAHRNSTSNFRG